MKLLTKKRLLAALAHDQLQAEANEPVNYGNRGPGHLNKYRCYLGSEENCWVQPIQKKRISALTKIIFSNELFFHRVPMHLDHVLLEALQTHFDIYLWQGNVRSFHSLNPLNDFNEFWANAKLCQPATKEQVRHSLARQSVDPDEYIILDRHEYLTLFQRISKEIGEDNYFNTAFGKDGYPRNPTLPAVLNLNHNDIVYSDLTVNPGGTRPLSNAMNIERLVIKRKPRRNFLNLTLSVRMFDILPGLKAGDSYCV